LNTSSLNRRLLQAAIIVGGFVPVGAGLAGAFGFFTDASDLPLANHFNYLSGLLFAIGLAFWSCVPKIETQGARVRLLTVIVFIGGVMRLGHSVVFAFYPAGTIFALCMELIITPLLCFWQWRISRNA
jgi:hypothetical protein